MFTLKIVFEDVNTEKEVTNPTKEEIESVIKGFESHEGFVILDSKNAVGSFSYIQALYSGENKFLVEAQYEEGKALYQYSKEEITSDELISLLVDFTRGQAPNIDEWDCLGDYGQYVFYKEYKLRSVLKANGFAAIKVLNVPEETIELDTSNIQVLMDYAKANNINTIFYRYYRANKKRYDTAATKIDYDLNVLAGDEIARYQNTIDAIDWDKDAILRLFCLSNSNVVSVDVRAQWFENLQPVDDLVSELKELYGDKLDQLRNKRDKDRDEALESLRRILLQDPNFALCTNQSLRRDFMRKFFLKNSGYQEYFIDREGYLNNYALQDFVDCVYAVYKQSKKLKN